MKAMQKHHGLNLYNCDAKQNVADNKCCSLTCQGKSCVVCYLKCTKLFESYILASVCDAVKAIANIRRRSSAVSDVCTLSYFHLNFTFYYIFEM